ncbi:MAG TPA: hypothetical protein DIT03_03140 [Candidatus Accumulibacter sp.]|nr:hypothetical protein [Accumulibacter sp.]HCN67268.1 hypothetical protein [Accumulibacter sp.]
MRAPRIRYRLPCRHERDARDDAVNLAPLDRLFPITSSDDFAQIVVVALIEVSAFAHRFVPRAVLAEFGEDVDTVVAGRRDELVTGQRSWRWEVAHVWRILDST